MRMGMTTKSAGEPSAELLTWDSEFWGVRIAKAPTLMDDWALDNTIGCMWLLIPAHEQAEIHRAEENGARMMDVRVAYERVPAERASRAVAATDSDLDGMIEIARSAFRGLTRFYADPDFVDQRCDDLYENWVRDSVGGWAAKILVIRDGNGPVGFITIHEDEGEASIGLIATAAHSRGRGIGLELTNGAINWAQWVGCDRITVVTQSCNIAAQRVFQRCGFLISSSDVWLHKHFYRDEGKP